MPGRPRLTPRTISAIAATTAAATGVVLQRRYVRSLARDPDYARLNRPLRGRHLRVLSEDGTALHAEVFGIEHDHTVVLAHGWTEQLTLWGPVIGRLTARGQRVVAYDLRGHGRSAPGADGDYSLERFGEDLEAVLASAVPDGRRATVAGHSLGAMSIAAWAVQHDVARRADAAALLNTGLEDLITGHLLFGEMARWLNQPRLSRALLGSRRPLPPFSTPLSEALIRYVAFGPHATAGDVAFYERMLLDCPSDVRAAVGVALSDMNLSSAVACLTVPTLVLAGDRDRLTPPTHGGWIADALPHPAGLIELPETGHMSPLECPRAVADALVELVSSVRSAADVAA